MCEIIESFHLVRSTGTEGFLPQFPQIKRASDDSSFMGVTGASWRNRDNFDKSWKLVWVVRRESSLSPRRAGRQSTEGPNSRVCQRVRFAELPCATGTFVYSTSAPPPQVQPDGWILRSIIQSLCALAFRRGHAGNFAAIGPGNL